MRWGHLMGPGVHLFAHLITSSFLPTGGLASSRLTELRKGISVVRLLLIFVTLYMVVTLTVAAYLYTAFAYWLL